ncbi:MAG: SUF system NifU family Fe-S cluster assembly protein [Bacilli bacterium]|jgi:nitrogen fixation NifU-like protein|nr:SUF system NifU family Fe-S cluster assembly protein [Bacilli bacterium]MCH4210843.1 SUF system NifU family Fe-S cluster assembly protein [Bacilli bacterium]MCH4228937.1 SUF system NifU family Fe-S cluster assembly protein [Bacilli bacterium]MCH4277757.1 SUF system NifU family Fe-S cluster assembly protein [Bacilli bacterium]MCI2054999.1 SUF system NifU family Fe-S cluster assembly protein [Bacilli bacterium]
MPTSIELTPELMREIIMDHYQNPRHKGKPSGDDYLSLHASSTNCIDDFDVYLLYEDGSVKDARWDGVACTISSASTDILCDRLIGLDETKAKYVITQYLNMIEEKEYDASVLDEALAFINTSKQAARIHCATMGWTAMMELLDKEEK